jgi:hypothetical protein
MFYDYSEIMQFTCELFANAKYEMRSQLSRNRVLCHVSVNVMCTQQKRENENKVC